MVAEVLDTLAATTRVVDGTVGGGGHALALLEAGKTVIGVDRDPEAVAKAGDRLERCTSGSGRGLRALIMSSTYTDFAELPPPDAAAFDGVLLDLGVSSHQLDDGTRGFSFREGAPLDMRMAAAGTDPGATGADLLNSADEPDLVHDLPRLR